jgi:hypothetical protein
MLAERVAVDPVIPKGIQGVFRQLPYTESPDVILYREVVARAILDAYGITGFHNVHRHEVTVGSAIRWIRFGYEDDDLGYDTAEAFFEIADVDLDKVREVLLTSINNGDLKMTKQTARSILLKGDAMTVALEFRDTAQLFQQEHADLQEEFKNKQQEMQMRMEASARDLWGKLAALVGIEDAEKEMEANAWAVDSQYVEHGLVFLKRSDPQNQPPGGMPNGSGAKPH